MSIVVERRASSKFSLFSPILDYCPELMKEDAFVFFLGVFVF